MIFCYNWGFQNYKNSNSNILKTVQIKGKFSKTNQSNIKTLTVIFTINKRTKFTIRESRFTKYYPKSLFSTLKNNNTKSKLLKPNFIHPNSQDPKNYLAIKGEEEEGVRRDSNGKEKGKERTIIKRQITFTFTRETLISVGSLPSLYLCLPPYVFNLGFCFIVCRN